MRITFYGSSHGIPETGRKCSSTMITVGSGDDAARYFIDMGTQSMEKMKNLGIHPDTVRSIFITHMHGDHTNGLIPYVDICSWYYTGHPFEVYLPEIAGADALKAWVHATGVEVRDSIHFKETHEGTVHDDGVIRVTAYRTKHCEVSYAYLVEAEGKRVLFTGDLKNPTIDFPCAAMQDGDIDLAICEAAHFRPQDYEGLFKEGKIHQAIINHYPPGLIPGIYELISAVAPMPVSLANDDLEIEL